MFYMDTWESYFGATVKSRGQQYFKKDKVRNYNETDRGISAKVQGTKLYRVRISKEGEFAIPECSCPYFAENTTCKHITAVLYYRDALQEGRLENGRVPAEDNSIDTSASGRETSMSNRNSSGKVSSAQKNRGVKSTSDKNPSAKNPTTANMPKMVPVSTLFESRSMDHVYYNLRTMLKEVKTWNSDIETAKELAEQKTISLQAEDVTDGHIYDFNSGRYVNTFRAFFKADPVYRDTVHAEEDLKKERELAERKKRYRWYYYDDRRPRYQRVREELRMKTDQDIVIAANARGFIQIGCGLCGGFRDDDYSIESNLCVHVMAALRLLDEYMYRFNPGDDTDFQASVLLENIRKNRLHIQEESSVSGKQAVIRMEPRISIDYGVPMLSFKIGTDKLYILKDLQKLVNAYIGEKTFPLGKNNELDFAKQTFTPQAETYFQMVEDEVSAFETMKQRMEDSYYLPELKLKGEIRLDGAKLDDVYDLFIQQKLPGAEMKASGSVSKGARFRFVEGTPKVLLTVKPERRNKKMAGVRVQADFRNLLQGKKSYYIFDREKFTVTRMQASRSNSNLPEFLKLADDFRKLDFLIGTKNLSKFFYRTLPELEQDPGFQVQIEKEDKIRSALHPEPEFSFYLDAAADGAECRPAVSYGDQKLNLKQITYEDLPLPEWRSREMEEEAIQAVEEYFPEYEAEQSAYRTDDSDDALFELLEHGVEQLMSLGEVHTTDAFQRLHIRRKAPVRIGVGIQGNLLDLKIETEDVSPEELQDLLAGYRRKKRYHRLKNGSFISLADNEGLETLDTIIRTMGMSAKDLSDGEMKLPLFRALYLDQMLEEHDEIAFNRDKSFRKLVRDFRSVKDSDFDVPENLKNVMRNYQLTGNKWLRTLGAAGFSGILADDMGLGKTLQMISVLAALKEEGALGGTSSLIVCPASLVYNWQEEFHRFAPELSVCVIAGTAKAREKLLNEEWEKTDVFVTSYDLLKRDIALYEGKEFLYEVIDEAQHIKNPKAAVTKAVKVIDSRHRAALTGTPIENQLSDLWSIFDFLMPGFLYDYERFRSEMETPIVKNQDQETGGKLQKMISPFILRRLKGDVLKDLPEKLEEIRFAKFDRAQQKLYDAQVLHMKNVLQTTEDKDRIKVLAEITKVRQICCDPELLFDNYRGGSAKREAAMDLITSAMDGGHKILLFSQFTSMLELLEEDLKKEKIPYYKITGATDKAERLRLVHSFNEDETPLFLISLKAGGTGLNLTGADVVIHYDPWWNLAAQNQATDRAHRIGQKNRVSVYKLIVKNTIEEKIVELQEAKRDLADAVIGGESTSLAALSNEELMQLLGE